MIEAFERWPRGARPLRSPECLPPWLRSIIAVEGLTTEALEARFTGGLTFERLAQRVRRVTRARRAVGLVPGERLLDRWVAFRERRSGVLRLLAHAEVAVERAGAPLVAGLERGDATLGELVRRMAPEAWREPLGAGVVDRVPRVGAGIEAPSWILRRYRIVSAGGTLAVVSEYFPWDGADDARA